MGAARRLIGALALVAVVALGLSACATRATGAQASVTPTPPVTAPTATLAIPTVTILTGSPWIPLASTSNADLIAAARDTLPQNFQGGDSFDITASSPAGTPALVRALRNSEFPHLNDVAVVPFLVGSGSVDVALQLNTTDTAFQSAGMFAGSERSQGVIWAYTKAQAISALGAQRHVALAAGFQPILVYWTLNAEDIETGAVTWNAGLMGPSDPFWLLRGANGVYYILANNGRIYALSEMPLHTLPPSGY